MELIDIGELIPITTNWWDEDGNAAEPSAITVTLTKPDGTTVVKVKADMDQGATTDVWQFHYAVDQNGAWRVHAVGTVDNDLVIQDSTFIVGEGSSTTSGPCEPWCSWADVTACGPSSLSSVSSGEQEYSIAIASEILYNLSGRVYPGICTVTRSLCLSCRHCLPVACSCEPVNGIDLGIAAPVWGVWDVIADGVTLPASDYTVHDRRYLVRTDGSSWPSSGTTERMLDPNTFRATWAYGRPIPAGARKAAILFATEIAKLCIADKTCQIPQRVTNISREGVSYTILDSMKMIEEGRTGLALVDLWLVADKRGRKGKPRIFSPSGGGTRMIA